MSLYASVLYSTAGRGVKGINFPNNNTEKIGEMGVVWPHFLLVPLFRVIKVKGRICERKRRGNTD